MDSLGTRNRLERLRLSWWTRFSKFDIDTMITQEFHHFSAVEASLPISNEKPPQLPRKVLVALIQFCLCVSISNEKPPQLLPS